MNLSVFIDFSLSVSPNAPPTPSACAELISQSPEVTSVAERVLAGPICFFFFSRTWTKARADRAFRCDFKLCFPECLFESKNTWQSGRN